MAPADPAGGPAPDGGPAMVGLKARVDRTLGWLISLVFAVLVACVVDGPTSQNIYGHRRP